MTERRGRRERQTETETETQREREEEEEAEEEEGGEREREREDDRKGNRVLNAQRLVVFSSVVREPQQEVYKCLAVCLWAVGESR